MKRLMWPENLGCSVAATKDGEWHYVSPWAAQLIGLPMLPPGGPVEIEMTADGWKVIEQQSEKDWLAEAAKYITERADKEISNERLRCMAAAVEQAVADRDSPKAVEPARETDWLASAAEALRARADAEYEAQSTDSSYHRMAEAVEKAIADLAVFKDRETAYQVQLEEWANQGTLATEDMKKAVAERDWLAADVRMYVDESCEIVDALGCGENSPVEAIIEIKTERDRLKADLDQHAKWLAQARQSFADAVHDCATAQGEMRAAQERADRLKAELAEANEKARYTQLRYRAMGVHECLACGSAEWECTCGKVGEL